MVILGSQGMLEVAFSMEKGQNWWGLCGLRNRILFLERGVWGGVNAGTRNLE